MTRSITAGTCSGGRCSTIRSRSGRRSRRNSRYGCCAKTPGPELGGAGLGTPRRDVLQVGGDEASLEALEQLRGRPLLGRHEVRREVVVRIADDLEVLGREALEEAGQLTLRLEDVLDVRLESQDRARALRDRKEPLERVVQRRQASAPQFSGESVQSPCGSRCPSPSRRSTRRARARARGSGSGSRCSRPERGVGRDEVPVARDPRDRDPALLEQRAPRFRAVGRRGSRRGARGRRDGFEAGAARDRRRGAPSSARRARTRMAPKRGHGARSRPPGKTDRVKLRSRPRSGGGPGGVSSVSQPS